MRVIYEWIENIAFYSVLLVLVSHVLPSGEQKKYVRFFMGLVFILVIFRPVLQLTGQDVKVYQRYLLASYEQELELFQAEQGRLQKNLEKYVQTVWESEEINRNAGADGAKGNEAEDAGNSQELVEPVEIQIGETRISP